MKYFLIWLIYPVLEASIQGYFFKKWPNWFGKPFNPHVEPMYLRIIRGIAYFAWAIWLQCVIPMDLMDIKGLWFILITSTFSMFSFWIVFDLTLNCIRGKKWDYSGTNSGLLDNLDTMKSQRFYIICKAIGVVICVCDVLLFARIY